jgi:hypothetical protein
MRERAALVADGLGLQADRLRLEWDLSRFAKDPGAVVATVEYPVDLGDVPIFGELGSPVVRAEHVEWVDPFRGGVVERDQPAACCT